MFKKASIILTFLALFYFASYDFYSISERRNLLIIIGLTVFFAILITPSLVKKDKKGPMVVDRDWEEGEFHNDFGRVGCASDYGAKGKFSTCGGGSCAPKKEVL